MIRDEMTRSRTWTHATQRAWSILFLRTTITTQARSHADEDVGGRPIEARSPLDHFANGNIPGNGIRRWEDGALVLVQHIIGAVQAS